MKPLDVREIYSGSRCEFCREKIWYDDNSDDWYSDGYTNRCHSSPYGKHVEAG